MRGSSSDNCSCTPVSCSSTSGSIAVDNVISLVCNDGGKATLSFYGVVISSTVNTCDRGGDSSGMRGALLPWCRREMDDILSVFSRGSRVFLLFDGNLSDFEGVVGRRHLGQYVLDGRLCCAVPFR